MILAVLQLTLACVLQSPSANEVEQSRASVVIQQVCTDWRAGRIKGPAQLESALTGLGRDAATELCVLLDAPPADIPIRPFAMASAKLGGSRSLPALLRLAGSPHAAHRVASMESLGFIGTDTTLPVLVTALDDADASVAAAAEKAIQAARCAPAMVANALTVGITRGKDKCRSARLLARLGTDHAHQVLLDHAESAAEAVCVAALQGLWTAARTEDGAFLLELLKRTKSVSARKQICLVLGRLKHKPAIDDLIHSLRDTDPGVSSNAHWALKQITNVTLKADPALWEVWKQRTSETSGAGEKPPAH